MASSRRWLNTSLVVLASIIIGIVLSQVQRTALEHKTQTPYPSARLIESVNGPDLFQTYCATCHGKDATGGGPAARALLIPAPDLTRIRLVNGGKFPVEHVKAIIAGDDPNISAHGSREMPVWGHAFRQMEWDQGLGELCIANLAKYLESIQQ